MLSRRPRSFDCPLSLQDGEAVWTSPLCRLTDCHTLAAAIEFCAIGRCLITVETFNHRIVSAPALFNLAAVCCGVAQRSNAHALRHLLPAGEIGSGRVAADGGVGHRSVVRCCSNILQHPNAYCESKPEKTHQRS